MAIEDVAGQEDLETEASTRLRRCCRLSAPWAAKASAVSILFSALLRSGSP